MGKWANKHQLPCCLCLSFLFFSAFISYTDSAEPNNFTGNKGVTKFSRFLRPCIWGPPSLVGITDICEAFNWANAVWALFRKRNNELFITPLSLSDLICGKGEEYRLSADFRPFVSRFLADCRLNVSIICRYNMSVNSWLPVEGRVAVLCFYIINSIGGRGGGSVEGNNICWLNFKISFYYNTALYISYKTLTLFYKT